MINESEIKARCSTWLSGHLEGKISAALFSEWVLAEIHDAILAEREECAKICSELKAEQIEFSKKNTARGVPDIQNINMAAAGILTLAHSHIRARSQSAPQEKISESQKAVIPPGMKTQFTDDGLLVALPDAPPSENKTLESIETVQATFFPPAVLEM